MTVYVIVSGQEIRVCTEEWRADLIYAEWMADPKKSRVQCKTCEVEE